MPSIFVENLEYNIDKADKVGSHPLLPQHTAYFDQELQLLPLDLASEFAKITFDHHFSSSATMATTTMDHHRYHSALGVTTMQQQQQQQTLFQQQNDGLNSGGESRSSCSEPDYAVLNEPTTFELLHIAAAAATHRKSQNTTECVPVPSSEHVAEIVGRQGCKIKALRAKTNTYIKTPVRGEDSVFIVTGRKEDVAAAKQEILSAAEHFTQIRASRRHSQGGIPAPGHITAYVRVPYKFVGLVVGPKGATIKRIQQQTHTYIVTPSRDKEPVFEVTGLSENVEAARREIENHIGTRTGQPLPAIAFLDANAYGNVCQGGIIDYEPNANNFAAANGPAMISFVNNNSNNGSSIGSIINNCHSIESVLNEFHLNGTETSSNGSQSSGACSVVSSLSASANSSILCGSYGSSTGSVAAGCLPQQQQQLYAPISKPQPPSPPFLVNFTSSTSKAYQRPTTTTTTTPATLPTAFLSSYPNVLSNNDDSFKSSLINSQVQIGYNAWANNTVNFNHTTAMGNDATSYVSTNGAKSATKYPFQQV